MSEITRMNTYFQRQLALYARYHCSGANCALHWLGIPSIFFAVLVILAIPSVAIGGAGVAVGTLLLIPATILWLALDVGIASLLLLMVVPLAATAEWVARTSGVTLTLLIASAAFACGWLCLIVGHAVFEGRKPAFIDDISLVFIGPMFLCAKVFVALGLRRDLATIVGAPVVHQA
jgi:uncharacterized membrane protein YGL010W